jgi:hypothetical protein
MAILGVTDYQKGASYSEMEPVPNSLVSSDEFKNFKRTS